MTAWRMFLNDKEPDCGVAACCNAILLWGGSVNDADAQVANDRFSADDYASKVLWGWWRRGIGNSRLGGFATIRQDQILSAVKRFGCAFVVYQDFAGTKSGHAVLDTGEALISWGREYPVTASVTAPTAAYAIAPRFHPILIWWALTNNPRWFLFLAPLWWPQ